MKPGSNNLGVRTPWGNWNQIFLSVILCFLTAASARAQEPDKQSPAEEVSSAPNEFVETDIGLDQMEIEPDLYLNEEEDEVVGKSPDSGGLRIKEDQIVTTNRSLKKIIEENEKLRQQAQSLDAQLKQLRGQYNIELNRVNTISVERDAYKNQNEAMSGLAQRSAEDIEKLQKQLAEKDSQLAVRPPAPVAGQEGVEHVEAPAGTDMSDDGSAPPETVGLGTIQVRKDDAASAGSAEHGRDILRMMDDVKRKGQKLLADEAKVHYNMGNRYYKQREYHRARREFQSALRLAPKDAFAHFNLAFISAELFHDYKMAIKHYREYLEINPEAEDAPLVREKIIEAELFIRAAIPSNLEKQVDTERDRLYR